MSKDNTLMDIMFSESNVRRACAHVVTNNGAPGVDKVNVKEASEYVRENLSNLRRLVEERKYTPLPVRRVWIPKDNGGKRGLGIPSAQDRIILQMIAQTIEPLYEPQFSDGSFGFRPDRGCHDALTRAVHILNEGYEWLVDIDLEKFFDTVNQDRLISTLLKKVKNGDMLCLFKPKEKHFNKAFHFARTNRSLAGETLKSRSLLSMKVKSESIISFENKTPCQKSDKFPFSRHSKYPKEFSLKGNFFHGQKTKIHR